jgi:hypothetical protein
MKPMPLKLDIAILGYEEDKDKLRLLIESFQKQMDDTKRQDIGVLFGFGQRYPDNIDDVKGRLVSNVTAKYYIIFDARESFMVLPNYIESMLRVLEANEGNENAEAILLYNGINIRNA